MQMEAHALPPEGVAAVVSPSHGRPLRLSTSRRDSRGVDMTRFYVDSATTGNAKVPGVLASIAALS